MLLVEFLIKFQSVLIVNSQSTSTSNFALDSKLRIGNSVLKVLLFSLAKLEFMGTNTNHSESVLNFLL